MPDDSRLISIVIPFYNEEANVPLALAAVSEAMQSAGMAYEVVAVDDGSMDGTLAALQQQSGDRRMRIVSLVRNFGKEAALAAGMEAAQGDAVVFLDGDLQHPAALIPEMIAKWRQGYEVVHAFRTTREHEPFPYRVLAQGFYKAFQAVAGDDLAGQSDFKLLDRAVVDALRECPERNRFFRGLVTWVGFRVAAVPMAVAPRAEGQSKWSVLQLFQYSVRNLAAFSSRPLYWIGAAGLVITLLGLLLGLQTLLNWVSGHAVEGFTTVILLLLILGGFTILCLGVIGVYIGQLYDEVKRRPTYVVRKPRA